MNRKDILKMCIQNLKRRRSRTLLTLLGVLIGCCSIVIMVSIGIGMAESQNRMLAEMGDLTIITVTPKQNGKGKIKLNDSALGQIRHMEHVAAVTPKLNLEEYECTIRLYAGANDRYVAEWSTVAGIDTRELDRMGYKLISGQNARQSGDVLTGQYLAYNFADTFRPEGSNTVNRWGGGFGEDGNPVSVPDPYFDAASTPISLEIEMNGKKVRTPLKTTGVLKEDYVKGSETSDGLLMNIDDLKKLLQDLQGSAKADPSYKTVLVKVTDITHVAAVEKEIRAMGYSTSSMESIREPMEKEARQKQMMLGGLGAISLFVAALGITNTMIMSISERTREIGIMKSLGCYVRDIRLLFLSEAGAIGLLGGLVGCVVSMLIANAGLDMILKVSVPALSIIYPVAIALIALSFFQRWLEGRRWVYPAAVLCTGVFSVLFALKGLKVPLDFLDALPLADVGLGWVLPAGVGVVLGLLLSGRKR